MLINCAAYQDGKKLGDIRKEEIHEYLSRPGSFVWVALKDATPDELVEMQRQFGLHELAVEDAQHGHQRPKLEEYGDSLFAVVHTVETAGDEIRVGELSIFAGRNYLLSVRNRTEQGFTSVRARTEREPHLLKHGSGFVLYALIDTVVDRYFPVVESLENELERLEERMFAGTPSRENIEALYALKQKLTTLKHAAGPLQETTGKLYGGRVPEICTGTQDYFRDVYDHLSRINQSIDSLRDMLTTAISVNLCVDRRSPRPAMKADSPRLASVRRRIGSFGSAWAGNSGTLCAEKQGEKARHPVGPSGERQDPVCDVGFSW